ncbi:NfeD family protein [uncultured Thiodictyon sp.]|jgi:membrane-bound serine protease (ClpP class)|uniref:NfeD family protein n=1 Tax=uncultured Thiodictyon sp. TaxID=1846217 RepID=UPI0025DC3CF1|nr:NfeD family protein [uncultured Thiodictyon sp.]
MTPSRSRRWFLVPAVLALLTVAALPAFAGEAPPPDTPVIALIARDPGSLAAQAARPPLDDAAAPRALDTAAAAQPRPSVPDRLLGVLRDPNVAYVLLLLGVYGLVLELANPGTVLPGTLGAVSLVLALYAFALLPVNWAGLALIGLGLGLMIAEAFTPSFGALGLGGIVTFVIGSVILIDSEAPGGAVSLPLIAGFAVASAVLLALVAGLAVRTHRRPVVTGGEQLIGASGTAVAGFPGAGTVHLHGEVWGARCPEPIPPGAAIRVLARDGLTLVVEPLGTVHQEVEQVH